jgi:type IV secretory pathway protease TraF
VTGRLATLLTTLGGPPRIAAKPTALHIWNASGSVPIGLYRLHPTGRLAVTQLVEVQSPEPLATFLADRRYLPRGIPVLKRMLALPGKRFAEINSRSRSTRSRWVRRASMTAAIARCPSGRAFTSSRTARFSS